MIKELLQEDLLLTMKNGKLTDYSDYFTALFRCQENYAVPFADQQYFGKYSPVHGVGGEKVHGFPHVGENWVEFQNWIDTAFTLATPTMVWTKYRCNGSLSLADSTEFALVSGLYKRPISSGNVCTTEIPNPILTASDGTVLAHGLVSDAAWEAGYNLLLIPYERSIKSAVSGSLRYIKNLAQFGDQPHYFRTSTLKFDGTGH